MKECSSGGVCLCRGHQLLLAPPINPRRWDTSETDSASQSSRSSSLPISFPLSLSLSAFFLVEIFPQPYFIFATLCSFHILSSQSPLSSFRPPSSQFSPPCILIRNLLISPSFLLYLQFVSPSVRPLLRNPHSRTQTKAQQDTLSVYPVLCKTYNCTCSDYNTATSESDTRCSSVQVAKMRVIQKTPQQFVWNVYYWTQLLVTRIRV